MTLPICGKIKVMFQTTNHINPPKGSVKDVKVFIESDWNHQPVMGELSLLFTFHGFQHLLLRWNVLQLAIPVGKVYWGGANWNWWRKQLVGCCHPYKRVPVLQNYTVFCNQVKYRTNINQFQLPEPWYYAYIYNIHSLSYIISLCIIQSYHLIHSSALNWIHRPKRQKAAQIVLRKTYSNP